MRNKRRAGIGTISFIEGEDGEVYTSLDFDLPFGISEETAEEIRNLAFGLNSIFEANETEHIISLGITEREDLGQAIDEEEGELDLNG